MLISVKANQDYVLLARWHLLVASPCVKYRSQEYHKAPAASSKCFLASMYKAAIIPLKVGSGTDPTEGAALAAALLDALASRASLTLATTHHASLKDMAVSISVLFIISCDAGLCFQALYKLGCRCCWA